MSNITPGSWVAYTTSYRTNNTTLPLLTAWTTGTGSLAGGQSTSGNGNQWGAQTTNTIEAGGAGRKRAIADVHSLGIERDPANTHWAMAAAVFQAAVSPLTWTGAAGSGGFANWNTTDINWTSANPSAYSDLDPVAFPDGSANTNITIVGNVAPGAINFTNATTVYSFSGGSITGGASVTLSGGGLVILNNTNTFIGPTTINSGTLQLGQTNAVGSSPVIVNAAGGLAFGSGVGTLQRRRAVRLRRLLLDRRGEQPRQPRRRRTETAPIPSNISGAGSTDGRRRDFRGRNARVRPKLRHRLRVQRGDPGHRRRRRGRLVGERRCAPRAAALAPGSLLGFDTTNGNFTYGGDFTSGVGVAKYGNNLLSLTGNINFAGPTASRAAPTPNSTATIPGGTWSTPSGGTVQLSGIVNLANIGGGATNILYTNGNTAQAEGSGTNTCTLFNITAGTSITYTTYRRRGTTLIVSGGTTTLSGVNTYAGITWDGSNHCVMTPTIVNAGGVLSFSSGASLPQVPSNYPYQDTRSLQLNGGTLLYTGTGTTDSTILNMGTSATPRSTSRTPAPTSPLAGAFNGGYFNKTGLGTLTLGGRQQRRPALPCSRARSS